MYIVGYWLNTPQKVPTNKMRAFVRKSGKIALRRRPSFSFCTFLPHYTKLSQFIKDGNKAGKRHCGWGGYDAESYSESANDI